MSSSTRELNAIERYMLAAGEASLRELESQYWLSRQPFVGAVWPPQRVERTVPVRREPRQAPRRRRVSVSSVEPLHAPERVQTRWLDEGTYVLPWKFQIETEEGESWVQRMDLFPCGHVDEIFDDWPEAFWGIPPEVERKWAHA